MPRHLAADIIRTMGWTFGSLIEHEMKVTVHCLQCHHSQTLDLKALRDRYGADTPAMATDLAPRMKCTSCKRRAVQFSYTPDYVKADTKRLSNSYAKARDGRVVGRPTTSQPYKKTSAIFSII
ncbi:hypothetical protein [Mesorhizobium loti]|uniref:hypothetical protein n=1 Tax=Rhizobium loti TaxID=381 RepID=UPI001ABEF7CA|nr:hypothetical protein [Mesorhizobium loti]